MAFSERKAKITLLVSLVLCDVMLGSFQFCNNQSRMYCMQISFTCCVIMSSYLACCLSNVVMPFELSKKCRHTLLIVFAMSSYTCVLSKQCRHTLRIVFAMSSYTCVLYSHCRHTFLDFIVILLNTASVLFFQGIYVLSKYKHVFVFVNL